MLLFFQLICNYLIETSTGDLYILSNNDATLVTNIHQINENLTQRQLRPPSELAFITDKKPHTLITTYHNSEISFKPKITHVFIDKKGRLILRSGVKTYVLPYTIYEVLKEPKFIGSVALFASKNIKLHFINNIGIFIITITLYVNENGIGGEFNYRCTYTPFINERSNIKVLKHITIDNVFYSCDNIKDDIVYVYGIKKHEDCLYFELIYRKGDLNTLTWHEEKTNKSTMPIVFMLIAIIVFLYFKRHKSRISLGPIIYKEKGYEIREGFFDGTPSLLKVYQRCDKRIKKEAEILRRSQRHNVIKFYSQETHKKNACLVFEQAKPLNKILTCKEIYDLLTALNDLQSRGITYNNLSIHNIFVNINNEIVLINFDCAEIFSIDLNSVDCINTLSSSINNHSSNTDLENIDTKHPKGCMNWRSPELIGHKQGLLDLSPEILFKADSFSIGILLYYNQMNKSPFNHNSIEPEENILTNDYVLDYISNHTLHDLICHCLNSNYNKRISISEIWNHPYFWSAEKSFNFMANLSDFIENKSDEGSRVFLRLERNKNKVFLNKWTSYIDTVIEEELKNFRLYNERNIKGLLRIIRNKGRHFKELPDEIKAIYGSFPVGFMEYYLQKFPSLLMVCHYSAKCVKSDTMFCEFYGK